MHGTRPQLSGASFPFRAFVSAFTAFMIAVSEQYITMIFKGNKQSSAESRQAWRRMAASPARIMNYFRLLSKDGQFCALGCRVACHRLVRTAPPCRSLRLGSGLGCLAQKCPDNGIRLPENLWQNCPDKIRHGLFGRQILSGSGIIHSGE